MNWQRFITPFVPGALFTVGFFLALYGGYLDHIPAPFLTLLRWLTVSTALLLAWRMNRSRLFFAVALLVAAERLLFHYADTGGPLGTTSDLVFYAVVLLLPLDFLLLLLVREKGLFSSSGVVRLSLLMLQVPLVVGIHVLWPVALWNTLTYAGLPGVPSVTLPLPLFALLALLAAISAAVHRFIQGHEPLDTGFPFALLLGATGLLFAPLSLERGLCLLAAELVLILTAMENAYWLAFRDKLTGLPGRRALDEALFRLRRRYVVAMVDIDFFKRFNDTYGHEVGDQVLRKVAAVLDGVRFGGHVYRYGGEEFSILFPGSDIAEALPALEELRRDIENMPFAVRGQDRKTKDASHRTGKSASRHKRITVSIGVAEAGARRAPPSEVVQHADDALYRAKKHGRNRVWVHGMRSRRKAA